MRKIIVLGLLLIVAAVVSIGHYGFGIGYDSPVLIEANLWMR